MRKTVKLNDKQYKNIIVTEPDTSFSELITEDLIGKRFGRLTVLHLDKKLPNGKTSWLCQCDCGNQCVVTANSLQNEKRKSCGCLHRKSGKKPAAVLNDQVYGKLTVLYPVNEKNRKGSVLWKCRCECGNEINVSQDSLIQGNFRSCGCVRQIQQEPLLDKLTYVEHTCIEVLERRKSRADNTSGFRGVSKGPGNKWLVTIGLQSKRFYVGLYSDFDDAVKARLHIEEALHNGFVETYQAWKQQAAEDQTWANDNPFYFNVEKSGNNFHIKTIFGNTVISTI